MNTTESQSRCCYSNVMNRELEKLSEIFRKFANLECRDSSPLYERLSLGVAEDEEILRLAANVRTGQPLPNLFFAAVHYLLLNGVEHDLARFYSSLTDNLETSDPCPSFHDFCLSHPDEIIDLLRTKLVQTNVVERCSNLLPAFGIVAEKAKDSPIALIEIGTSAGLNLFWDRYGYNYGDGITTGDLDSPVQLMSVARGDLVPPIPKEFPQIAFRAGLDLNPIDVNDKESLAWLRALIWPEHRKRVANFYGAVRIVTQSSPSMVAGDASETLPEVLKDVPDDSTLCVFHTHTLNQFTPESRQNFYALMENESHKRAIFVVSIEGVSGEGSALELNVYNHGARQTTALASCDAHGRWLKWLAEDYSE